MLWRLSRSKNIIKKTPSKGGGVNIKNGVSINMNNNLNIYVKLLIDYSASFRKKYIFAVL